MTSTAKLYTLWDDLDMLDLGESGAHPAEWNGAKALYLEKLNSPVFLRDEVRYPSYRLQVEVAIPGPVSFIGLVFGAKDAANYELIYLAPIEIQYDPIMNGSMTWQIYNGPSYQKPLPNTTGAWHKLTLEVQPGRASVYLGDHTEPQLVIPNLQHGGQMGRVGVWSYLPGYVRNLTIQEIHPASLPPESADYNKLKAESVITEWHVSKPFMADRPVEQEWSQAFVEENGTLNISRIHKAEHGATVEVKSVLTVSEEQETILSLGFSDSIRLWINDQEVYQGDWCWNPPLHDGRIRPDYASVPVKWKKGLNTIRAELSQKESFGWGLTVRTGLMHIS